MTTSSENESVQKRKNIYAHTKKKIIDSDMEKVFGDLRETLENVSPNTNVTSANKKTFDDSQHQITTPMQHTQTSAVESNQVINASQTHLRDISKTQSYSTLIECTDGQQAEISGGQPYNPQSTFRTESTERYNPNTYTQLVPNTSTAASNVAFPIGYSSSNRMDYYNGMGQGYENPTAGISRMFGSCEDTVRPTISIPHTSSQYMGFSENLGHGNSTICNSSAGNVQERTEWPALNVTPSAQNEMNLGNIELENRDKEMRFVLWDRTGRGYEKKSLKELSLYCLIFIFKKYHA